MEEIELNKHQYLNIYVFGVNVQLNKYMDVFERIFTFDDIKFKIRIRLYNFEHPLYGIVYRVLFATECLGLESKVHDWGVSATHNTYMNGVLEKFLLRTVFSFDLTNKILDKYKL